MIDDRSEECKSKKPIPPHSKTIMSKINIKFNYGPKVFNTLISKYMPSICITKLYQMPTIF